MSLVAVIEKLEEERILNRTLLDRLLEQIDADILRNEEKRIWLMKFLDDEKFRLVQKKDDLMAEFAERDAAFVRLIDGDQQPLNFTAVKAAAEKEQDDADLAA